MRNQRAGWLVVAALLAGIVVGPAGLDAQQPAELSPEAKRDLAYTKSLTMLPGGTPEDQLWQVLVLFGAGDSQPAEWKGQISVAAGDLHAIEGYRFELPADRVLPQGGFQLHTRIETVVYASSVSGPAFGRQEKMLLPKGLWIRGAGTTGTSLQIQTGAGSFSLQPMALRIGQWRTALGGRVQYVRTPPATDLSGTELRQHDFPAIASGGDGTLWVTWLSYHDRQEELNFRRCRNFEWSRLIPVARAAADLWRPQVATDGRGQPWLIWSQQVDGNWDIYAMPWDDNKWGRLYRITSDPSPDIEPAVARAPDGTIYVAWQALRERTSRIHLAYLKDGAWSRELAVTDGSFNDWQPSIAVGPDGRAWIAWDRYRGSYDVFCRSFSPSEGFGEELVVAGSPRFEAYASVAVDQLGRPWIAWEEGDVNWGKDLGYVLGPNSPGTPLGRGRTIRVAARHANQWMSPAPLQFQDPLQAGATEIGVPVLFVDPRGNLWLVFKRRYSRLGFRQSVHWESFLTRLEGNRWSDPVPLASSWTRRSIRLGITATSDRLWLFWPHESRDWAFASRPRLNRVMAGSLPLPEPAPPPQLSPWSPSPVEARLVHPNEATDVAVARAWRVRLGPQELRLLRGDLHRHTELSQDQGGLDDGTVIDFFRYMIDVADMDFGALTDHQAGGTDYWNFMTLKLTDMYHFPARFTPLYGYERNLANPHGHRNIFHTRRGYPIVPFFPRIDPRFMLPDSPDGELLTFNNASFGGALDNDTALLYEELRKSGGLAIPHTPSSTTMGTDWHIHDPKIDPVVEIYQGARQSAEHKNAPRGVRDGEEDKAIGGFQPAGLVWNAWKKGYRLGVIASSDHFSTHISYAMVWAPATDRRSILDAIRQRRTYGATDNIILEFWMGEHFMGDDFRASSPPKIRVRAIGTGPIARIHLIRDATFLYQLSPGTKEARFEYLDRDAGPGEHWYYVRVEQADGELAWSSPIWVRYE